METNKYHYVLQDRDTKETFNLTTLWSPYNPHIFTTLRTAIGVLVNSRHGTDRAKKTSERNIEIVYLKVEKIEPISWKEATELDRLMTQKNKEITLEQYNTL